MQIVRCDSSYDAAWNAFVEASPNGSFYHLAEWRAVNTKAFGHETVHLAALDEGRIVGVFPLVRLKSLAFGTIGCSMPFVNYGGPCADRPDVEEALLRAADQLADEWRADYLEIRSRRELPSRYPWSDRKVSMTVALQPDADAFFGTLKTPHRAEVRRAYKRGYEARTGREHLDAFFLILSESWRDLGTPIFQRSYLDLICDAFGDAIQVMVVYAQDGRPAAGAFSAYHHGTVEGLWLGMRQEYRQQLVGYVLYWELIMCACNAGAHTYHLGRSSKDSSAEQFKRKWNAEAQQLYWHYLLRTRDTLPGLNPDNPKYAAAIAMWRRLPLSVTQTLGPLIARSIP